MDTFIIAYIATRMKAMRITSYQFEPFCLIHPGKGPMTIYVDGDEFYYLVSKELKPGTEIQAASNIYQVPDYYNYQLFSNIQEFNGPQLRVNSPDGSGVQVLEFIRVMTTGLL